MFDVCLFLSGKFCTNGVDKVGIMPVRRICETSKSASAFDSRAAGTMFLLACCFSGQYSRLG
jgi:hypothetical protein